MYYLNEKNLIHDRIPATISKFSPQIFETYFKTICREAQNLFSSQEFIKPGVSILQCM